MAKEDKPKLNSMRFLEAQKVAYEAFHYDEGFHDAVEVAALIGAPVEQVYKTLVVEKDEKSGGKPVLIMIPAARQLDLKKFAAAIGQKRVGMASHADAERLTGLKVGGISALALVQKHWEVYLDRSAVAQPQLYISAGQRGTNLKVPTQDLIRILNIKLVDALTETAPGSQ